MEAAAGNGVGKKGELAARAPGPSDEMELRSVAEAGGDEHLAAQGMPVVQRGGAVFEIAASRGSQRGGNRRDAVHDQVFVWGEVGLLSGRGDEGEGRTQNDYERAQ